MLFLAGIVLVAIVLLPVSPPSRVFEKWRERKEVYASAHARIEAAGGWQLIQKACLDLSTNAINGFFASRGADNSLPPVLAKLEPREIYMSPNPDGIPIMRIRLFGMHRTGYFDAPCFGIWVVCTNISTNYIPPIDRGGPGMTGEIEQRGNSIFEVR